MSLGTRAAHVLDHLGITTPEQYIERREQVRAARNTGRATIAELDAWAGITSNGGKLLLSPQRLEQLDSLASQPTPAEQRELVRAYCALFHMKRPRAFPVGGMQ